MCLSNVTTEQPLVTEKDIVCYKYLKKIPIANTGDTFKAKIHGLIVEGVIYCDSDKYVYLLNDYKNGLSCGFEESYGYKYSWVFDGNVKMIDLNGSSKIKYRFETPYQRFKIEENIEYDSLLERNGTDVDEGFHSFADKSAAINESLNDDEAIVATCIIPKGAKYYIGKFHDYDSIASDKLKYIKIEEICV